MTRFSFFLGLLFFSSSVFAQYEDLMFVDAEFERALSNYKEGIAQYRSGNFNKAIDFFKASIEANDATENHGSLQVPKEKLKLQPLFTTTPKNINHTDTVEIIINSTLENFYYPTSNANEWISYINHKMGNDYTSESLGCNYALEPLDHTDINIRHGENSLNYVINYMKDYNPYLYETTMKKTYDGKYLGGISLKHLQQILLKSIEYLKKTLPDNHWAFAIRYFYLGIISFKEIEIQEALKYFINAKEIALKQEHPMIISVLPALIKNAQTEINIMNEVENKYLAGIKLYNNKEYNKALELFRFCFDKNKTLLYSLKTRSGKLFCTQNAGKWIGHVYYKIDNKITKIEGVDDLWDYMYMLTPSNQCITLEIENKLNHFKNDIVSLTKGHKDIVLIDSFYNAQLKHYKELHQESSLYVDILVSWAKACGLANHPQKERELLKRASNYIKNITGKPYPFMTVIERFKKEDEWANSQGGIITGRYVGQTGYITKEPKLKENIIQNEEREPLHRKKGQIFTIKGEKPVLSACYHRSSSEYESNKNYDKEDPRYDLNAQFIFSEEVKGRYICIEILDNYNGDEYASIYDLCFYDQNGKRIPSKKWKILYADSEDNVTANYTANHIIWNGNDYWQTKKGDKFPHYVVLDLNMNYDLIAMDFKSGTFWGSTRDKYKRGTIKNFHLYIKSTPFKF